MLVLSRKEKESFLLGDNIEITVLEISGDKAKIAINAPRDITILRKELAEAKQANLDSAASVFIPAKLPKLKTKDPSSEEKPTAKETPSAGEKSSSEGKPPSE